MSRKFNFDRHGNLIAETSKGDMTFDDLEGLKDFIRELEEIVSNVENADGADD